MGRAVDSPARMLIAPFNALDKATLVNVGNCRLLSDGTSRDNATDVPDPIGGNDKFGTVMESDGRGPSGKERVGTASEIEAMVVAGRDKVGTASEIEGMLIAGRDKVGTPMNPDGNIVASEVKAGTSSDIDGTETPSEGSVGVGTVNDGILSVGRNEGNATELGIVAIVDSERTKVGGPRLLTVETKGGKIVTLGSTESLRTKLGVSCGKDVGNGRKTLFVAERPGGLGSCGDKVGSKGLSTSVLGSRRDEVVSDTAPITNCRDKLLATSFSGGQTVSTHSAILIISSTYYLKRGSP